MSVRERVRPDGTRAYMARRFMGYTGDGKRDQPSRVFGTKRAAELYDAKLLAEHDAMRGRSGKMTLARYIETRYWPVAERRLAATSLDTYEREIRLRILPSLGGLDVRDVDRAGVQRMVDGIATESVARKCVSVLKTVLNEAKADGLIRSNPAEAAFAMPRKGARRDNGLVLASFGQIAELLAAVRENGSQSVQRVAYTGLLQGLRPEERYALDWADLDREAMTVSVRGAYVTASPARGGVQMKGTKTDGSRRVIPMHPDFAEWLEGVPSGGGPFIVGADGGRISPSTAQKRWRRFLDANPGAPRVTIENMRHSFATAYLHAGGRVEVLSKILGHSSIQTTVNRYHRPDVEALREGVFR